MKLTDEIERIQRYLLNPPSSEQDTCVKVITPILQALGYSLDDMQMEGSNAAGNRPDYTLLPHTAHTWYLEAKPWKSDYEDRHVHQAISYPHTKGGRWVVLSYGREWRLYDDFISGVEPPMKLVAVARVDEPGVLSELLFAISKESVCSGQLEAFAKRERARREEMLRKEALATALSRQLSDPRSEATLGLLNVVSRVERLDVSADEIVAYFTEQRQTTYSPAGDGAARLPKISPLYPTPLTSDFLPLTELSG